MESRSTEVIRPTGDFDGSACGDFNFEIDCFFPFELLLAIEPFRRRVVGVIRRSGKSFLSKGIKSRLISNTIR
jgi:hypothetical protein